jgi:tripeptide aminopeptidase
MISMGSGIRLNHGANDDVGGGQLTHKYDIRPHTESMDLVAELALANLRQVIAIDSQSDEDKKENIPSTEGQRVLSNQLREFFEAHGRKTETDALANLLVTIPSTMKSGPTPPPIAYLVHLDTGKGTVATNNLHTIPNWDGSAIQFPENAPLIVNVEKYPHAEPFVGQTVIHGDGKAPVGLDNKNGMAELMALSQLLASNPDIEHGEIILVFRPDEEIGNHKAVEGLVAVLQAKGVRYGWTIDGHEPFEINTSNFHAQRAEVLIKPEAIELPHASMHREITVEITGVDTHGATAYEEGYLNSTKIVALMFAEIEEEAGITIVDFERKTAKETTGILKVVISGNNAAEVDGNESLFKQALENQICQHRWKGATSQVLNERAINPAEEKYDDGGEQVIRHLFAFLNMSEVEPLLSEDSHGDQGYSNPFWVERTAEGVLVRYRLRDFSADYVKTRGRDIERICAETGIGTAKLKHEYSDSGPSLAKAGQLVEIPHLAFESLRHLTPLRARELKVRGGTGIDPFTEGGIFIGNLGTGYLFLESGKEITTKEMLALHTEWLFNVTQVVAQYGR